MAVHKLDRFFRVERGPGEAVLFLNSLATNVQNGWSIAIIASDDHLFLPHHANRTGIFENDSRAGSQDARIQPNSPLSSAGTAGRRWRQAR